MRSRASEVRRTGECAVSVVRESSAGLTNRCLYIQLPIQFEWNEFKRRENLRRHGLDFADAEAIFMGVTVTFEDTRFDYGEQRFVTLGFFVGRVVSIAYTESAGCIRIISFRKASRHEQAIFFQNLQD